jgi:uncharacterized protein
MAQLTDEQIALRNEILRVVVGSTVHGTAIEGVSDRDLMGICVPPREYLFGLDSFEQWVSHGAGDGVRNTADDVDVTVYSLLKFLRLAAAGNPSILVAFWVPDEFTVLETEVGKHLREHASLFVSRQAGRKFLGYLKAQREKMLGVRGNRTNRPELVERHGFDTKFAYEMVRLAHQGVELLTEGRLELPMPASIRLDLMDIRTGKRTQAEVLDLTAMYQDQLHTLLECEYIPERTDLAAISALSVELHEEWWNR